VFVEATADAAVDPTCRTKVGALVSPADFFDLTTVGANAKNASLKTGNKGTPAFVPVKYSPGITSKVVGRVQYPGMWSDWTGRCDVKVKDVTNLAAPTLKADCFYRNSEFWRGWRLAGWGGRGKGVTGQLAFALHIFGTCIFCQVLTGTFFYA